jgi:hypothetical protein
MAFGSPNGSSAKDGIAYGKKKEKLCGRKWNLVFTYRDRRRNREAHGKQRYREEQCRCRQYYQLELGGMHLRRTLSLCYVHSSAIATLSFPLSFFFPLHLCPVCEFRFRAWGRGWGFSTFHGLENIILVPQLYTPFYFDSFNYWCFQLDPPSLLLSQLYPSVKICNIKLIVFYLLKFAFYICILK